MSPKSLKKKKKRSPGSSKDLYDFFLGGGGRGAWFSFFSHGPLRSGLVLIYSSVPVLSPGATGGGNGGEE